MEDKNYTSDFRKQRRMQRRRELDELVVLAQRSGQISQVGAKVGGQPGCNPLKNGGLGFREALVLDMGEKLLTRLIDAIQLPAVTRGLVVHRQGEPEGKANGVSHICINRSSPCCFLRFQNVSSK